MLTLQNLIVALLVPGCAAYAAWKLMPATARRSLAAALLRLPHLPAPITARLDSAARGSTGCGCDGCDHAPAKSTGSASATQPIRFHPRARH